MLKTQHIYLTQRINGRDVSNGQININIDTQKGNFYSSFYRGKKLSSFSAGNQVSPSPNANVRNALAVAFNHIKNPPGEPTAFIPLNNGEEYKITGPYTDAITAKLEYYITNSEELVLTWFFVIPMGGNVHQIYVSTPQGNVIHYSNAAVN
jgi:hypothetical protein